MSEAVRASTSLTTRPYRDSDEAEVLELLSTTLGPGPTGRRSPEFFRWKHDENPFGRSFMLVAELDGRIVGLRAFMRWSFRSKDRVVRAVRAVDTATHPDHQGQGIFSRLTLEAIDGVREVNDLVFNTPNQKSLPGYLKMGWRVVGKVPISVRPRRPIRMLKGVSGLARTPTAVDSTASLVIAGEAASDVLSDPEIDPLLEEIDDCVDERLATPRTREYLNWRYGSAPSLGYRAIREYRGGVLIGIALFRVRRRGSLWESTVAEVIVRPGDSRTALRLLRRVVAAAPVDHVTCSFPHATPSRQAGRSAGFFLAPGGMTFVVNPLGPEPIGLARRGLEAWALSLGDLEVF